MAVTSTLAALTGSLKDSIISSSVRSTWKARSVGGTRSVLKLVMLTTSGVMGLGMSARSYTPSVRILRYVLFSDVARNCRSLIMLSGSKPICTI